MFGFNSWNYAERLVSGEIDETTNNGSESLNAVFNRHSQAGFKGKSLILIISSEI